MAQTGSTRPVLWETERTIDGVTAWFGHTDNYIPVFMVGSGLHNRVTPVIIGTLLGRVLGRAVDYADLYFQASRHESWSLEDGIVKEGTHGIEQGVGVRAVAGLSRLGFAAADQGLAAQAAH